jgi:hypothetical protein
VKVFTLRRQLFPELIEASLTLLLADETALIEYERYPK